MMAGTREGYLKKNNCFSDISRALRHNPGSNGIHSKQGRDVNIE